MACDRNKFGQKGYRRSCTGAGGKPELWCADFAAWTWDRAGALNTGKLNSAAGSFGDYGPVRRSRPQVGDAVLFNYDAAHSRADHVAIVVQVNSDGNIVTIGGDENGEEGGTDAHFASTSQVVQDRPYSGTSGPCPAMGKGFVLSGYVSPVEDDLPYTKEEILDLVKQGVAAELRAGIDARGITPAQGAEAAFDTRNALKVLAQEVAELKDLVKSARPGTQGTGPPGTP